jgi:hypothetical protein
MLNTLYPLNLKVVATSLDCLTPVLLEGPFADVDDLKWCLKVSPEPLHVMTK